MTSSALAVAAMMLTRMLTLAPPGAAETAETASAKCDAGRFCAWLGRNYTGDRGQITRGGSDCLSYAVVPYRRSFINNSSIEGYFYSQNKARAVIGGINDNDIGFAAGSFLFACVSCRSD